MIFCIDKKFIEDTTLSNQAFVVLCGLKSIMHKNQSEYFVSTNYLCYQVFGRIPGRYEKDAINNGYQELINRRLIKEVMCFGKTEFKVDLSEIKNEEQCLKLSLDEMQTIMNIEDKTDKFKLLRYFSCLLSTFTLCDNKVGNCAMTYYEQAIGIPQKTIINYNEILYKKELVYIIRNSHYFVKQHMIQAIPNIYARWENRKIAQIYNEEAMNDIQEKYSVKDSNKGYVYIVRVNDYYKIGITICMSRRIGEYTKLMEEPEVICCEYVNNYRDVEHQLHKIFDFKNTNGEWFKLTDSELNEAINYIIERKVKAA